MPRYMVERIIPGAGELPRKELNEISFAACKAAADFGAEVEWVESFVTSEKMYCVYNSPDESTIRRYIEESGFPAASIAAIKQMLEGIAD